MKAPRQPRLHSDAVKVFTKLSNIKRHTNVFTGDASLDIDLLADVYPFF